MEKIRDIVKNNIKEVTQYEDNEIEKIMTLIERKEIRKSTFFSKHLYKTFDTAGIIYVSELYDLTKEEVAKLLGLTNFMVKGYIKDMNEKIIVAIKDREEYLKNKETAHNSVPLIQSIIKTIKLNPRFTALLKEEIIFREEYNNDPKEIQRRYKSFYCSNLELNNEELNILRGLLSETVEYDTNNRKFIIAILNITKNLHFYLKKLQYKTVINKNYLSLDELNLTPNEIRTLDRSGISNVSDLIELNNLKEQRHVLRPLDESIRKALREVGIIIPNKHEDIDKVFEKENAGIRKPKRKRITL